MTDLQRTGLGERNVEQAITALKRGSYLLKYGRRGKPKFCPFRLSNDETTLIWYVGKKEKQLQLSHVSKIIPGQRTEIFRRYPRPEKDYQSFSLLYENRSLDVICKEKDEAEIWFLALGALITRNNCQKWRSPEKSGSVSSDNSSTYTERNSQSLKESKNSQTALNTFERTPQKRLGRAFSDIFLYSEAAHYSPKKDYLSKPRTSQSSGGLDDLNYRSSADTIRFSLSSAASSSSLGTPLDDLDTLSDVFIWGEGISEGLLGGGTHNIEKSPSVRIDALLPKILESTRVLDAQTISCGRRHAVLVTKQGEIFSWGEGSGGRLGHGVEAEVSTPKLINALRGLNIELVACGEYHTCAITVSGDVYTWGDGIHYFGLLGHGTEISHWTPKKLSGQMEGMHISYISCGPWHSACVTSAGLLFTFGDGTFGALGHGNRSSICVPKEVENLKGNRTVRVSCGVWHTAAIVDVVPEDSSAGSSSSGKIFTWGDGDKGQLGHGDKEPRLIPVFVSTLDDKSFCQVACGHSMTIALSASGQVYTMGSGHCGQLGDNGSAGSLLPKCIEGKMSNISIEEIACGSHHFAVLSSKSEVYTWGRGANGQLGHGDNFDRNTPTLVEALLDTQVKSLACGSNFTVAICLHKRVCTADQFVCSDCQNPFNFRRKRHNCYNCGLGFCKACSSRRSLKASLAPNMNKPYRVCEDCYFKLNKDAETRTRPPKATRGCLSYKSGEVEDQKTSEQKPRGILSRLSSFDSFRRVDNRNFKQNRKHESNNDYLSPNPNGSFQRESSFMFSSPSVSEYVERISSPISGSGVDSLTTSPVSSKSSPYRSISLASFASLAYPEVMDDSKRTKDNLTKEISILREQVEVLAQRSQLLEAELERTSRQLKEATELAREEEEKKKAAKEVIKSLTAQLNEMAITIHQGSSFCQSSSSYSENTSNSSQTSTWSQLAS